MRAKNNEVKGVKNKQINEQEKETHGKIDKINV